MIDPDTSISRVKTGEHAGGKDWQRPPEVCKILQPNLLTCQVWACRSPPSGTLLVVAELAWGFGVMAHQNPERGSSARQREDPWRGPRPGHPFMLCLRGEKILSHICIVGTQLSCSNTTKTRHGPDFHKLWDIKLSTKSILQKSKWPCSLPPCGSSALWHRPR